MNRRIFAVVFVLAIVMALVPVVSFRMRTVEAQGVANSVITNYLDRMGVTWRKHSSDANAFVVNKTQGLKRADKIEIIITNLAKDDLVTLRAYPLVGDKYLGLAGSGDQRGLTRAMLERNATAFGAYFIDDDGDLGFRYVFTTESGLGYESFKVAVNELVRIADDPMVALYNKYR